MSNLSPHLAGILLGGFAPALLFGVSNILVKASTNQGISSAMYLACAGTAVLFVSGVLLLITGDRTVTPASAGYAFAAGALWGSGMGCIALALHRYQAPISELTPLFNMNTLVAVLLALWVFAEWREVHVPKLLLGSIFIVIGGTLVARS